MRLLPQLLVALIFLSFIYSLHEFVVFPLGVLCNGLHGTEALRKHISVFWDLVGGNAGHITQIGDVKIKGVT